MNSLKQIAKLGFLLLMAALMVACAPAQDDLNRYISDVKARPASPIDPIPAVRTYTPYDYEGLTGRDPFRQSTSEGSDEVTGSTGGIGPSGKYGRNWSKTEFPTHKRIPGKIRARHLADGRNVCKGII
jgi:Tfp pilus assembly protein PilP